MAAALGDLDKSRTRVARRRDVGRRTDRRERLILLALFVGVPIAVMLGPLIEWPALQPRGTVLFAREDGVDRYFGFLQALPAIDIDGDGELDVAVGVADSAFGFVDRIEAWNCDGARIASFASEDSLGGPGFASNEWIEAAGDVDGDGLGEVLLDRASPPRLLTLATGSQRELVVDGRVLDGAAGVDLDADGLRDLVLAIEEPDGSIHVTGIDGATSAELWSTRDRFEFPAKPRDQSQADVAVIPDVDGDGIGDVACIAGAAEIAAELAVLSGATGSPLIARPQDERAAVESAGDVDGDGRGDLVVISWRGAIVLGGHDLGELQRFLFPCPYDHRAGGVGDLDGDGLGDVFVAASRGGGKGGVVRIHRGSDGSVLREIRFGAGIASPSFGIAAAGDLDGDGVDDLSVCEPRVDEFDYHPSWLRTPRRSRVTVWSGAHFASRSEPLEIR